MNRLIYAILAIGAMAAAAAAEPLTVQYTEPAAQAGALKETRIYYCYGATCTNWVLATTTAGRRAIQPSDDGNGGDAKSVDIQIPLNESQLPITIRVAVTSVNTNENEITRTTVTDTHTFNP